jgi:chemotaxis protein MotA
LQLVLDHQERRKVEDKMVTEMSLCLSRLQSHLASLNNFTRLAPVFGFVGTIIGLINVLNHMGDAAQIGNGVAISLLTTFYGLLLAHLFFGPLSNKLASHIQHEKLKFNIIIEGVLAICDNRPSLEVVETLSAYVVSTSGPATASPVKSSLLANIWGWVWKPGRLAR